MSFPSFTAVATRGHALRNIQVTRSDAGDATKTERHGAFVLQTQAMQKTLDIIHRLVFYFKHNVLKTELSPEHWVLI
jgi:hypothetical protein